MREHFRKTTKTKATVDREKAEAKAEVDKVKAEKKAAEDEKKQDKEEFDYHMRQSQITQFLYKEYGNDMIDAVKDYMYDNPKADKEDILNFLQTAAWDHTLGIVDIIKSAYKDVWVDIQKIKLQWKWDWQGMLAEELYDRAAKYVENYWKKGK
jgi:hypothetical protein